MYKGPELRTQHLRKCNNISENTTFQFSEMLYFRQCCCVFWNIVVFSEICILKSHHVLWKDVVFWPSGPPHLSLVSLTWSPVVIWQPLAGADRSRRPNLWENVKDEGSVKGTSVSADWVQGKRKRRTMGADKGQGLLWHLYQFKHTLTQGALMEPNLLHDWL